MTQVVTTGLEIMRVSAQFTSPLDLESSAVPIVSRDTTYQERIGWREIVARARDGIALVQSNVRATETSDELRKYPQDLLSNPLNDREANLIVARGEGSSTANNGNIGRGTTWLVTNGASWHLNQAKFVPFAQIFVIWLVDLACFIRQI